MEKIKVLILIIAVTLVSTLVSGYQFGVSDQGIFIPYIYKMQDPSLFPADRLFSQFTANASFFYQIMAYMTKYFPMETVFFLGFLFVKTILFLGIFLLSKEIFKKTEIAYLSLLPFLFPKFVGGTANYTYDNFFGYRSVGIVFLVYFLLLILRNRFIKASLLAGIGLFFHPLSIIPVLPLSPVQIIGNSKHRVWDLAIFFAIIVSVAIAYQHIFGTSVSISDSTLQWFSIIKSRNDYIFASTWNIFGWLSLGLYLALTIFCLVFGKITQKKNILTVCTICLFVFLVNFAVLDIAKLTGIAKFQLVRSVFPIALIALILSPTLLMFKNRKLQFLGIVTFTFLCLNLFYLFLISFVAQCLVLVKADKHQQTLTGKKILKIFISVIIISAVLNLVYLKNQISYPAHGTEWTALQLWANKNTDNNSKFLVPFNDTGFRIYAKRPIVGDIKDGAVVVYDKNYATYWNNLRTRLTKYESFTEKDFLNLRSSYNFDYIVTHKNQKLTFKKSYENQSYSLYRVQ